MADSRKINAGSHTGFLLKNLWEILGIIAEPYLLRNILNAAGRIGDRQQGVGNFRLLSAAPWQ